MQLSATLGELKASGYKSVSVKDELRLNLIKKLKSGEKLFPGIVGYDETVVPQLVNAILARHNTILLGLRGQAKSRIEEAGYAGVTNLKKDDSGVWRAKASKGGATSDVSIDFQGNVTPR